MLTSPTPKYPIIAHVLEGLYDAFWSINYYILEASEYEE